MVNYTRVISLIFIGILLACSSTNTSSTSSSSSSSSVSTEFFSIVYQAEATRKDSTFPWTNVSGIMQMKFTQATSNEGTYIFYLRNYDEPQFVFNTCSGGWSGNFTTTSSSSSSSSSSSTYNVSSSYAGPQGNTGAPTTDTPSVIGSGSSTTTTSSSTSSSVDTIVSFDFSLQATALNLQPQCDQSISEDQSIQILRLASGEIIMTSVYRDILMRPVLTSESQVGASGN